MSSRRFLPSLRSNAAPVESKAAVDRRHSAGPNYAFAGSAYTPVSDLELDRTIKDQYERDVWVWRACDARAKTAAGIDVVVKNGRGRKGKPIEGHPLAAILNGQANPYEPALEFRWRLQLLLDLSVTKGAFVEVTEGRGNIIERVDLLNPLHTWPIPHPDRFVDKFEMRLPNGETFDELPPYKRGKGGVLWFKRPHPTDPYQSNSWIRAAGLSIDLDYWARRYNLNFLFNDGRPGGVLAIKSGGGDDEWEGIDEADAAILQQRMSGGPDAAGKVTILEADHLEFHDLSTTARDAQYVEGRAITQREILVAAGTPLSVIGDASGRTYDNADAEARNYWKKEMKPELRLQANTWERVTPGGVADESEVVDFDWSQIEELAYDERMRERALAAEVDGGKRTIDSYLEETGREPMNLPGTRVLWLPTGKAPVGDPADITALLTQGQSAPPPPELGGGDGGPPALPPGDGGQGPADDDILDAELIDPLDETQYAVKSLSGVPAAVVDSRRAQHGQLIDRWTATVADEVRAMLRRQEKAVLSRLKGAKSRRHTRHWTYTSPPPGELKALDPAYVVERLKWVTAAMELLIDVVKAAFGAAGEATAKQLGGPAFDPAEVPDAGAIVAKTVRLIAEGLDARAGRLQEIIAESDAAGDPLDVIAGKVADAYLSADTWAEVTSRSVVGAMNAASLLSAVRSGAVAKRWLATDDERTRPTHHDAEGQVRPLGLPFTVGEAELMFPHDPTGLPGEIINCRCTMIYALGKPDPDADLERDLADLDAFEATGDTEWKAARRGGFSTVTVTFDPTEHPRDYRGRFLDVPDVTLPDGTAGVAVSADRAGNVTVAKADGDVVTVAAADLAKPTTAPKPKPDADLPEPSGAAPKAPGKRPPDRYELPNGRYVQQRGDTWILYDAPGKVLYVGDAEGMQAALAKVGVTDQPEPDRMSDLPAVPGYVGSYLRTVVKGAIHPVPHGSHEEHIALTQMQAMFQSPAETVAAWQLARLPDGRYGQAMGKPDAQDRIDVLVGPDTVSVPRTDLEVAGPPPYRTSYDQGAERHVWCSEGHRHWGAAGAAGVLVRNEDRDGTARYLMQLRSLGVQHGGTWSTPGGAKHIGEDPGEAALREAVEELGEIPDGIEPAEVFSDDHGGWGYDTVVLDSPTRFDTENADREGVRTGWFTAAEIAGLRLHPSFKASWPALLARLEGDQAVIDTTPHPENAGHRTLAPVWSDDLEEPMAATAAVKAAIAEARGGKGSDVPVEDMRTVLSAMLGRAGIAFDPTAEPSMLAGEHAAKAGQTGDGAKARAMIPTVEELVDKGMTADEAAKEWKRLYNNARFRVRDARLKAIKAAGGEVAKDKEQPAPPKVPVEVLEAEDVTELVATIAASVLADIEQGPSGATKPKALYTLTHEEQLGLHADGKFPGPGPGGMAPGSRWASYADTLEDGDAIPVVGVWIQGHKIEHGTVFKLPDTPPVLIEHGPDEGTGVVSDSGVITHPAYQRATMIAARWAKASKDVKPELRGLQTGFAWLTADNPADNHWAEKYGIDGFKSAATGGDGTSTFWAVTPTVGMMAHEFGHNVDRRAPSHGPGGRLTAVGDPEGFVKTDSLPQAPATAEIGTPPVDTSWGQARTLDQGWAERWSTLLGDKTFTEARHAPGDHVIMFGNTETDAAGTSGVPTDYGRASIAEDFAESVRLYLKDRSLGRLGFLSPDPGETSGPVLRFADMYPERARYLDTVFGNAPVAGTAWQSRQRLAITATLKATTKNDDEWSVSDGSGIDAAWPTNEELEASFAVPEQVVAIARAEAFADLTAELKAIEAKQKAEEAAAAAKLAAEQKAAAELAAKAKVATDAITAALADAKATPAKIVPDKDAVAKIRKRKAWVKWNAKKHKTTPIPATGENGMYRGKDLVATDEKHKLYIKAGGQTTIEFDYSYTPETALAGEGGFRFRGMPISGSKDENGREYINVKTVATNLKGAGWEPALSDPVQRIYLDTVIGGSIVRVDKLGHSEAEAVKISEEYEEQALAQLTGQVAESKGIPTTLPEVAGLTDPQVGEIIAGAQDVYDQALTETWATVNPSEVELAAMEYDGGDWDDPVTALDALLTGHKVRIGDDQAVAYTVISVALNDAGDGVDITVLTEGGAGIETTFTAGDVDVLHVLNAGTPEDAAIARQDYITNAVIQALAKPGSGAHHGAPSSEVFDEKKRKAAGSWLHKKGKVVHPKAKDQSHPQMQAKANIAAELASRLNNEADWELFRAARHAVKANTQGDFYAAVPFDNKPFAETTEATRQSTLDAEVSNRVAQWASSSGDNNPWAVLMQRAIAEEFATGGDWNPHGMSMSTTLAGANKTMAEAYDQGIGAYYRRIARVMWENTQAEFAEAGITEVSLYRGMKSYGKAGQWSVLGTHEVTDLMPANSWSSAKNTAHGFSGGHRMLVGTFPVSRVLGSARSGYGCWGEWEFVVLNGPGNVTVYSASSSAIPG